MWRWAIAAAVGLSIGVIGAEGYARLAAPCYAALAGLIAEHHPWKIVDVVVAPSADGHGSVLRLTGDVYRHRGDAAPVAIVQGRVSVGAAVETPVVFWTVLLAW